MNDKEEFFKDPDEDAPPVSGTPSPPRNTAKARRKGGFLKTFYLMIALGLGALVLAIVIIDLTNSGDRVRKLLGKATGSEAIEEAPLDQPARPSKREVVEIEKIVEVPVERIVEVEKIVEVKPPMPSSYISWQKIDTAKLWSDIPIKTNMVTTQGGTAVAERERDASYEIEMTVNVTLPKPNQSVAELAAINPNLPEMLPALEALVAESEVSPFFHYLYQLKTERVQQKVTRLDQLLSRHNFYDCETVLQTAHPETGQKLLLVQGEMDVVSDGSDGDRWPEKNDYITMSDYYQPFTSYGWAKRTSTPNPLLEQWKAKLKEYEDEFAIPGLTIERNRFLRESIETYKLEVADISARSYLIAEADPFFVLPLSFLGRKSENEWGPGIGDYGVIIYEDKLYPAIAGDAGPSWKFGEASLRIAKELNERADPYNRPVSDLKVTYLIFPDSADPKKGPPDLERWDQKCSELLESIGGIGEGYELHRWEDLIAKKNAEKAAAKEAERLAAEAAEAEATDEPEPPVETPAQPAPAPVEEAAP